MKPPPKTATRPERSTPLVFWVCLFLFAGRFLASAAGTVSNATESDLRTALDGGGLVTIDCDGTIELSGSLAITNNTTIDAASRDFTLSGSNAVRILTISSNVILRLNHLTLANGFVRGTNSTANNGAGGEALGGAILNNSGTLEATDCVFTNNNILGGTGGPPTINVPFNFGGTAQGGAIYNNSGSLLLTNVTFIRNASRGGQGGPAIPAAPSRGGSGGSSTAGAIYSRTGLVVIAHCFFLSNSAPASIPGTANGFNPSSGSASAGAITSSGTTLITDTRFERQFVGGGQWFCNASAGAVQQISGVLRINRCSFISNNVVGGDGIVIGSGSNAGSADGGALTVNATSGGQQMETRFESDAVVSNSCFVGNRAKGGQQSGAAIGAGGTANGGAIYNSTTLQLFNCTLARNTSSGGDIVRSDYKLSNAYGGAFFNTFSATSIVCHVTIALNTAVAGSGSPTPPLGGGIYIGSGKVTVRNSIVSSNAPANNSGTLTDQGINISSDASCAFSIPGSLNNTNPKLFAPGNYGGPTLTLPLMPGSPALNAANPAFSPAADQRGVPRPQGSGYDIGAVEAITLALTRNSNSYSITQGAPPNAASVLQGSTNLISWTDLQTNTATADGAIEFSVSSLAAPAAYFRSTLVP